MDIKSHDRAAGTPVRAGLWNRDTDEDLVCVDVHQETHDVKTFTFASPEGKSFAFEAGQYFLFDLDIGGEAESRCYSISSSPCRRNAFSVTVKRVTGGKISNWLHDNIIVDSKVRANGPLGHFIRPSAQKYLFLSGGSGITPVMSMLRELADTFEPADVVFLHAARTPKDLVFRDELTCHANRIKDLRLQFLPETVAGETHWPGLTGRISVEYVRLAVPDLAERIVMCCGPAPFMAAARNITAELGVPPSNYIEESFDAAVIDDVDIPLVEEATTRVFQVEFSKQGRKIEVSGDQTLLSCAKKAGVRLPSSCSNGVCGTCKSKLLSGSVDMAHNGGIRQREIDAGLFLPCCSKPLSDLVVER
ncbi:oxidoreductase FAD-binding protein domain protein [Rhizobium freirei PRF 81]|uniref:Oxidoreductase FAD-binding protein domain protein n=1 Tax=Rhizobium freirei PRF 81 TaxID=363754 RepID=N6USP9_9HYPH|nr:FAD-binding oxidoreductase [Rhizobium freirei]ENN84720.1 oxidoreductase FAD-binding protein domain protein [Rhizobium freirei PRF 81]